MEVKRHISLICIFLSLCILGGCTQKKESGSRKTEKEDTVYYKVQETMLPDPDKALREAVKVGGWAVDKSFFVTDGTIYRLAQVWNKTGEMYDANRYFIEILREPYKEWETYEITSQYWDEADSDYDKYVMERIWVNEKGDVYCIIRDWMNDGYCLGLWEEGNEEGRILYEIPKQYVDEDSLQFGGSETLYAYKEGYRQLILLNDSLEEQNKYTLSGMVYGIIEIGAEKKPYYYGVQNDVFGIWSLDETETKLQDFKEIDRYSMHGVAVTGSKEGNIFFTNGNLLWRIDATGKLEAVSDFLDQGYLLDQIYSISSQDEKVHFLISSEGHYYLLSAEEGERPDEKQEIKLAGIISPTSYLQRVITKFNNQNDKYHITIQGLRDGESETEYKQRVQMEVSAGKGADLFFENAIDATSYAKNGFLQRMEGENLITDADELWESALACGKFDGIQYGIPYEAKLMFAAYSKDLTGDRESWTVDEMMEAVKKSDAKVLSYNIGINELIYYYGLLDVSNKEYIDWEAGESHLSETPFLRLLEFTQKYAWNNQYVGEETGKLIQDGTIAATTVFEMSSFSEMNYLKEVFNGNPSYVGFPSTDGSGIYVKTNNLYLSATSDKKEGAKIFLEFLISEQVQMAYAEYDGAIVSNYLPVRKDAIERGIQLLTEESDKQRERGNGITYKIKNLTTEQVEQCRILIEKAQPYNYIVFEIEPILWGELEPYFNGEKTAEEATKILDKRVQLYLDERK